MSTVKKTYDQILSFAQAAHVFLNPRLIPGAEAPKVDRKFNYALQRMVSRCTVFQKRYATKVEDINVKHCSADKDGNIARENGQYKFSKEEFQKRNEAVRALSETEQDIEPFMTSDVPETLTFEQVEAFRGFVIPEEYEPKFDDPEPTEPETK